MTSDADTNMMYVDRLILTCNNLHTYTTTEKKTWQLKSSV